MVNSSNPFASSQRALLETAQDVSFKTLEGVAKLSELNLQATRTIISEATEKLASKVDSGARITNKQVVDAAQPSAQKVAAYMKHVYDIVTETNTDIVAVLQKHALAFAPQMLTAAVQNNGSAIDNDTFQAALTNPFGAAQKAFQQAIDTATEATTKAPAASRRAAAAAAAA